MGVDNGMAASREIILPGQNRIGEKIKHAFKNIANNVIGRHGIMQASGLVEAPTKPGTKPETKTDQGDQSKKDADKLIGKTSPKQPLEKPPKKNFIKTRVGRIGLTVVAGLGSVGIGAAVINQINPDIFNRPTASQPAENNSAKLADTADSSIINQIAKSGAYDISPVPGRQPEPLSAIPTETTIEDIPHIPEEDSLITPNVKLGAKIVQAHEILANGKPETTPTTLVISGYLVAKELQSDGSVFFAIELPYLSSPKDILKKSNISTTPEVQDVLSDDEKSTQKVVGGSIVWMKMFEGTNPSHYPFNTTVAWGKREFQSINPTSNSRSGTGSGPLTKWATVGDLIRASVELDVNTSSQKVIQAIERYAQRGYADTEKDATQRLKEIIDQNYQNSQKLLEDTGKSISLDGQVKQKRYVFTPKSVAFLPK